MKIEGGVAIVTGAARGIGRATSVMLAEAGAAAVVLVDVRESELEETRGLVSSAGAEGVVAVTDITQLSGLQALFADVEARFSRLDVVFNNAGLGEADKEWPEVSSERAMAIVDVNLRAVILGTQLALEPMRRSGGGVVVNTSSGAAHAPLPPQAVYAATKAGVVHFTKCCVPLAESHGVRVNCVCPGLVETPMLREDTGGGTLPDWLAPVVHAMKMLEPEDIGRAVLQLIEDDTQIGAIVDVVNEPA